MTLTELLYQLYAWADARAVSLFLTAVGLPGVLLLSGMVLRAAGARALVANALGVVVLALATVTATAGALAVGVLGRNLLDGNALLLLAPVLGIVVALLGQRALMPLGEVPLYRTLAHVTGAAEERADAAPQAPGKPSRVAATLGIGVLLVSTGIVTARQAVAPAAGASGSISLAIADINNETGEDDLDGLSGLLITSLGQSKRLEVMSRLTMLDLVRQLGRRPGSRVDESLAREVCRKAGTSALAIASLRRFDRLYSLELSVVEVESGKLLFTAQEKGDGKGALPSMLDRIAERTRAGLSERASEISANRRSVATLATPVMDAYQRYFEAEQLFAAGDYEGARARLDAAVAADPQFGLAHFKLAFLSEFRVKGIDQQKHLTEAKALIDRAPARDQLLMRGWITQQEKRIAEATSLFERALAEFPPDKMAYYMAGDIRFHHGDQTASIPFFEKSLEIDPTFQPALNHLAHVYLRTGEPEKALEAAQRATARHADTEILIVLAMAQTVAGDERAAEATVERAREMAPAPLRACFLPGVAVWIRLNNAEPLLTEAARCDKAPDIPGTPRPMRELLFYLHTGQWTRALERAATIEVLAPPEGVTPQSQQQLQFEMRRARIALLAELGRRDEARALLTELEAKSTTDEQKRGVIDAYLWLEDVAGARAYFAAHPIAEVEPWILSAEARARKDHEEALRALAPMLAGKPYQRLGALLRAAQIRVEQGRGPEAVAHLDEYLGFRSIDLSNSNTALMMKAVYLRGRAKELAGDRPGARKDYERVTRFWKNGDKQLLPLRESRARLASF